jgi:hypothetical protein
MLMASNPVDFADAAEPWTPPSPAAGRPAGEGGKGIQPAIISVHF